MTMNAITKHAILSQLIHFINSPNIHTYRHRHYIHIPNGASYHYVVARTLHRLLSENKGKFVLKAFKIH